MAEQKAAKAEYGRHFREMPHSGSLFLACFGGHCVAAGALALGLWLIAGRWAAGRPFWGALVLWAALLGAFVACCVLSARFFRGAILDTAVRMKEMKARYPLIDADPDGSFQQTLHATLDSLDSSLGQGYSAKLLQKQAEFDSMKNQINPHFLYNTLDSIRGYSLAENAPITADMIEMLSRIFRYTISQKNELISLEQELNMLVDYIRIRNYRLTNHISLIQKVAPGESGIYRYKIPKLILQPFIENAINHGMRAGHSNFQITITAARTQSRLVISIADNGCGMSVEQLIALNEKLELEDALSRSANPAADKGSGIALINVNTRIKLLYGSGYGVTAYSTPNVGSEFQITLPYDSEDFDGEGSIPS